MSAMKRKGWPVALGRTLPHRTVAFGAAAALAGVAALVLLRPAHEAGRAAVGGDLFARLSNAGLGSLTVGLPPPAVQRIYGAPGAQGRPIVLLDAGHGGRDPGARSQDGEAAEKDLSLALASELRDLLVKRGRVRVAMTREGDQYLTLDERAAVARRLGAALFVSLHMDSAPNKLARGVSVYSLSDVASDGEAARFALAQNRDVEGNAVASDPVEALLSDLEMRTRMGASADLAARVVAKSAGRVGLRPQPHRFAAFQVLRQSHTPAVLVEAGYLSNLDDEALLRSSAYRSALAAALAQAIEADVATRAARSQR